MCLVFFRHEALQQELIRTISNVNNLQLNTLVYIINIMYIEGFINKVVY